MAEKVLIWGTGKDFWENYNLIHMHQEMNNINIIAYIDAKRNQMIGKTKTISPDLLLKINIEYDYIIITTSAYWDEIVKWCEINLKIGRERIISFSVFKLPFFDWKKYINIRTNPPSIIAEQCIGGYILHDLRLPFETPFINTLIGHIYKNDVWDMFENLDKYMKIAPSKMPVDATFEDMPESMINERIDYPRLWYDNICLHGFHYSNQEEFLGEWEKRRKRYNADNKVVIKVIYSEADLIKFEELNVNKKIGIYYKECEVKDIYTLCGYEDLQKETYKFGEYIRANRKELYKSIDIFSFLYNGK